MSIRRSFSVPKERRRFEDAHKKMFDAMDSIDIAEEKKRLRQQQFQNAVPDAIKVALGSRTVIQGLHSLMIGRLLTSLQCRKLLSLVVCVFLHFKQNK